MHASGPLLLAAAILIALLAPNSNAGCGDCDDNGFVDILDTLEAMRISAGLSPQTAAKTLRCDVHPSLGVTALDGLVIARFNVGLVTDLDCFPVCSISAPMGTLESGDVNIDYDLSHADAAAGDLTPEFSTDGGMTFAAATGGPGGDGVTGLSTSISGDPHTYVWGSLADVPSATPVAVLFRITVTVGGASSSCTTSFDVQNSVMGCPTAGCGSSTPGATGPGSMMFPPAAFDFSIGTGNAFGFSVDVNGRPADSSVNIRLTSLTDDCDLYIGTLGISCGETDAAFYTLSDSGGLGGTAAEFHFLKDSTLTGFGNVVPITVYHYGFAASASFMLEVECVPSCTQVVGCSSMAVFTTSAGAMGAPPATFDFTMLTGDSVNTLVDVSERPGDVPVEIRISAMSDDYDLFIALPGVPCGETTFAGNYRAPSSGTSRGLGDEFDTISDAVADSYGDLIPVSIYHFGTAAFANTSMQITCSLAGNAPPLCMLEAPAGSDGSILLTFDTIDPEGGPIDIGFDYSLDGGVSFQPATSSGTGSLTTNPTMGATPGTGNTFGWNSFADGVGTARPVSVIFRVTLDDGSYSNVSCDRMFLVDNSRAASDCLPAGCATVSPGSTSTGSGMQPPTIFDFTSGTGDSRGYLVDVTGRSAGSTVILQTRNLTDDCDLYIASIGTTCGDTNPAGFVLSDSGGLPGVADEFEVLADADATAYGNLIPVVVHHRGGAGAVNFDFAVTCTENLDCGVPRSGALATGGGNLAAVGATAFFQVDTAGLPLGLVELVITTSGVSGDIDLYVGLPGTVPGDTNPASYLSSSELNGPTSHHSYVMPASEVATYAGQPIAVSVHADVAGDFSARALCTTAGGATRYVRIYQYMIGDGLSNSIQNSNPTGRDRCNVVLSEITRVLEQSPNPGINVAIEVRLWDDSSANPFKNLDFVTAGSCGAFPCGEHFNLTTFTCNFPENPNRPPGIHHFFCENITSPAGVLGLSFRPGFATSCVNGNVGASEVGASSWSAAGVTCAGYTYRIPAATSHEHGHYLVLEHTSEVNSSPTCRANGVYDSIGDTAQCPVSTACFSCPDQKNLVFPIVDFSLGCSPAIGVRQDNVTTLQRAAMLSTPVVPPPAMPPLTTVR